MRTNSSYCTSHGRVDNTISTPNSMGTPRGELCSEAYQVSVTIKRELVSRVRQG